MSRVLAAQYLTKKALFSPEIFRACCVNGLLNQNAPGIPFFPGKSTLPIRPQSSLPNFPNFHLLSRPCIANRIPDECVRLNFGYMILISAEPGVGHDYPPGNFEFSVRRIRYLMRQSFYTPFFLVRLFSGRLKLFNMILAWRGSGFVNSTRIPLAAR